MEKTKSIERAVLIGLMLSLAPGLLLAATPPCWSNVSGDVVFDVPMTCYLSDRPPSVTAALKVVADGTTIELGNQAMRCIDDPDLGQSCQGKVPDEQSETAIAIDLNGHTNVTVKGPGAIDGFDRAIVLVNVGKATVRDLTITGPSTGNGPGSQFSGPNTTGIYVSGATCPGAIVLDGNDVSNHRYGIVLEQSSCVKVQANDVHDNRGYDIGSHGLLLVNSGDNTITNNQVNDNGLNNPELDGGITLTGALSASNRIAQNTVLRNCGDGISTRGGARGNPVGGNVARTNPPPENSGGKCFNALATYDMGERVAPRLNTWRKNNTCDTQNGQIPAGVCDTTLP